MKEELTWKLESDMQKELKNRIDSWKSGESRDGYVEAASGIFSYKGIKYLLKILRYFNHTNKFTSMSLNRISDSHCVVEYPKATEKIVDMVKQFNEYSEFLYHDTLHTWNDKQTIEDQINSCHKMAKGDIDSIPEIIVDIKNKINEYNELIRKLGELATTPLR